MKTKVQKYSLLILTFIGLLSFFTIAHPLLLFDSDDWGYAAFHRRAIPNIYEWNPTRIFPEIFYPFCAKIAAYIVFPITKNFVVSFNIVSGVVLSLFIVIYLYLFYKVCTKVMKVEDKTSVLFTIVFLISHFVLLDSEKVAGSHLFWAHNVSCVYYYTIPSLLNACLIFAYLIRNYGENPKSDISTLYSGFMLAIIYLAINSNMYQSAILIIFISVEALFSLFENKFEFKNWVGINKYNIIILVVWLISVLLESRGPRSKASWLGVTNSWLSNLKASLTYILGMISGINKFYLPLFVLAAAALVCLLMKKKRNRLIIIAKLFSIIVLYFLFLVLVNSKVSPDYNSRMDVTFGLWFFIAFTVIISIMMLVEMYPKIIIALPLIMLVLTNECIGNIPGYGEYNITNMDSENVYEIDQYIVADIIEASENGISEISVKVPQFSSDPDSNWPLTLGVGNAISNTLYTHNVISRKVKVTIIPDKSLNENYNVKIVN